MDDYLLSGPMKALDVITEITGSEKVNLLGLCLGGTLTMATLAYLDAIGSGPDQHRDVPEHLDRLQRARPAGRLHRRSERRPAGDER